MEENKTIHNHITQIITAIILLCRFLNHCMCACYVCILFEIEILPQFYEKTTFSTSEETDVWQNQ